MVEKDIFIDELGNIVKHSEAKMSEKSLRNRWRPKIRAKIEWTFLLSSSNDQKHDSKMNDDVVLSLPDV